MQKYLKDKNKKELSIFITKLRKIINLYKIKIVVFKLYKPLFCRSFKIYLFFNFIRKLAVNYIFVIKLKNYFMNIEDLQEYCLKKPLVTQELPFDEVTLVFKVAGKMFALTSLEGDFAINLKCDPENAVLLREQYDNIKPAFHMNKTHWITVAIDGTIGTNKILEWINDSYDLVVAKIPKKTRNELGL